MDYHALLPVHSLTRWAVLLTASWAVARACHGWLRPGPWTPRDALAGLMFTTVINVQATLGLMLYFKSPYVRPVFATPAYATSSAFAAFFTLAHPAAMLAAAVAAQVAFSVAQRTDDDRGKFRRSALGYTLAAVLVVAAVPWPPLPYGRPLLRWFGG